MIAKERQREIVGVLCPERLYSTKAVMRHAGIGRVELADMRRAGLKMYKRGTRQWYVGADLIRYITDEVLT